MDGVTVSVCIVTYNHERYIEQAVESALVQQTTFSVEIVIGEDCSTDRTRSILRDLARQHPDKIRLRLAEQNEGAKTNFMGALSACRGRYVAMLEGDDYWTSPGKLQLQIDALQARPDWAACFHPAKCVYEDGLDGPVTWPVDWRRAEGTLAELFEQNFIATSSVVFRNRLFTEFPSWFKELTLGDWPLHILNAVHGNIGFLPDVLSVYRIHRHGLWSGQSLSMKLTSVFEMLTAVDRHFAGKYASEIDRYRLHTVHYLISEVDAAKGKHQVLMALQQDYLNGLQQEVKRMKDEITVARDNFYRLAEVNCVLQTFYDAWSRSLSYRIVRELRRPAKQLWSRLHHLFRGPDEPQPPTARSVSKAA